MMVEDKLFMKIRSSFFIMIHNTMSKNWIQICTNIEVIPNKATTQNEYFVRDLN